MSDTCQHNTRKQPPHILLLACIIIAIAFALRISELTTMPRGIHHDEASNIIRAWRMSSFEYGHPLYFGVCPEPFDGMARALWATVLGLTPFSLKIFSAFINLLSVAAVGMASRALFPNHKYRHEIALTAMLTLAVIPAWVIIGRSIYRANWVPVMQLISLAMLVTAWRTQKRKYYILAGLFTGLTGLFYLAGLAFFAAVGVFLIINAAIEHNRLPHWRNILWLGLCAGLVMLPWIFLYLRIPNWLGTRLDVIVSETTDNNHIFSVFGVIFQTIRGFFIPGTSGSRIRYDTYTTAFLNPGLAILGVLGFSVLLLHWRKINYLGVSATLGIMLLPAIASNHPDMAIRMVGAFGPLALLVGLGAGTLFQLAQKSPVGRRVVWIGFGILLLFSPSYTYSQLSYHYNTNPTIHADPENSLSIKSTYHQGYYDLLQFIRHSEQPIYIPLHYIRNSNAVAQLRPSAFPQVKSYTGERLPDGMMLQPPLEGFDFSPYAADGQYILLEPDQGSMTLLPPLPLAEAQTLPDYVITEGTPLLNEEGWLLAHQLSINEDNNPFSALPAPEADQVLAVFDDNLELVGIDAPSTFQPGDTFAVTLYWRLREATRTDYLAYVQPFAYTQQSKGSNDSWILKNLFSTPMWQPGQIVWETRLITLFDDAPPGGYRYLLGVYTQPDHKNVGIKNANGEALDQDFILLGRSTVPLEQTLPTDARQVVDGAFADGITLDAVHVIGFTQEELHIQLLWSVKQQPSQDYILFLHIQDDTGALIAQQDTAPLAGQLPTGNWLPGIPVMTEHTLSLPTDAQPPYSLYVGMYQWPSMERLPVEQDGATPTDRRAYIALEN